MKRISLAAGIVLLAFLATVTVGNHPAAGVDKPPVVEWKAVPYTVTGVVVDSAGTVNPPLASLTFTAPGDGFVWLNSTGFCSISYSSSPLFGVLGFPALAIGWRTLPPSGSFFSPSPGDAVFNNIPITANVMVSLPYSASALFPVFGGTQTFDLEFLSGSIQVTSPASCSGVNVVMFTNTQLP